MKKPSSICQPSLLPFPFFLLALFVAGCRTNKDILNDYEKAMVAGDYAAPVAELEEKADASGEGVKPSELAAVRSIVEMSVNQLDEAWEEV